ncbi:glycosyltransferase family 2 protein [Chloroflexus aggregans]|uniref:Glycosyl transferase family 2 n=1 Tax=Chloroflexus aggregans (strain MD-66 / DSM 9485) TaxID=326427 RepID=B8GBY4_CHLAD|nr:glycosyltransferase [Chloroflexus aggregans]ACL24951.1 glycosyl transferase family 2 [Chloroflexus aggregans DSM 9485]
MSTPSVDVVISTYGRGAAIDATIASIRQSTYPLFTLWVLDQSEDNRTEECVRRYADLDPRIRYLRRPVRGISATRNAGAAMGSAPYILFTNDDCVLDPDWIGGLVAELRDERVWLAFGAVLPGPHLTDTDELVLGTCNGVRRVFRDNRFNLGFGHGHNMGVRRDAFERLGGFDELIGAGAPLGAWEERDLGYRALKAGGWIVFTPQAVAYHHHWQSWQGVRRSFRSYGIGAGAIAGKYVRCGDLGGLVLLSEWLLSQGLRQIVSGIIKWRRRDKVLLGLDQLYYPFVGLRKSWQYPVNRAACRYAPFEQVSGDRSQRGVLP